MSYMQAGVKTTSHKVSKKRNTIKDPHLTFAYTPIQLAKKFTLLPHNTTIPEVTLDIPQNPNRLVGYTTFTDNITSSEDFLRENLASFAKNYLGVRYRSGGKSAKGFDCSGFTSYILANFGYNITSASVRQAEVGETIDISEARKGDLVFFGNKDKKGRYRVNHAAMVVSEAGEDFAMIHASRRGIVIDDIHSSSWKKYYAKRFIRVKRVLHLEDLMVKK